MRRPGSVLFACTNNAVRSPMAEGLLKHLHGRWLFVDSVGIRTEELDPFVVAVMDEIGLDASRHHSKSFDMLEDSSFDLVVTLSPEAHHVALEWTRNMAAEVEFWPTMDPTAVWGTRDQMLDAYRQTRESLYARLRERFPAVMA
jgi:protein-tyrosine-phosphatase